MRYIPNSPADRQAMLAEIGIDSVADLFAGIPDRLKLDRSLKLPGPLSEPEIREFFESLANRNVTQGPAFVGAGVYPHYVPVVIDALISRSEFFTAYTPYQAELSQGTLQAIFEFQTFITQLTGMDIANASLYDGSTAMAEGMLMARRITGRNRFVLARTIHPEYRAVAETYTRRLGVKIDSVRFTDAGQVDSDHLESLLDSDVAAVLIQSPNFFGTVEDTHPISESAHRHGALSIVTVNEALSLGVLRPPGETKSDESRADIVVGEAQSLGIPMNFGGPHLGFIASRQAFLRQLPGRLVGMGRDMSGRRGFVATLATREQHIRREKATSNICTNQSLCALMTTIFLALLGPRGLAELAAQNVQKAAYLRERIRGETSHEILFDGPRFNEFAVRLRGNATGVVARLREAGIVAGLGLGKFYPELEHTRLLCVTELHTQQHMTALLESLR